MSCKGTSGALYGFGFLGTLVYYIQHATSFAGGLIGILKAMVWPAVLIHRLFVYMKM